MAVAPSLSYKICQQIMAFSFTRARQATLALQSAAFKRHQYFALHGCRAPYENDMGQLPRDISTFCRFDVIESNVCTHVWCPSFGP
jgi:hypothetical protein